MELNDLRAVMTVISFIVFVGIVVWAMAGRRRAAFDEAARLPFLDGEIGDDLRAPASTGAKQ